MTTGSWGTTARATFDRNAYTKRSREAPICAYTFSSRSQADFKPWL
jgi:hypothetical protein